MRRCDACSLGLAVLLVLALTTTAAAQNATLESVLQLAAKVPAADHRVTYGADPLQFGELRLPAAKTATAPFPVVMLVHGGCWANRLGKLDPRATSVDLLRPIAEALSKAGIATWNVEYRRVGDAGGGWPGTFQDIGRATDTLRQLAPKHRLDLQRVVVAGHSSGGHLAMWIAARGRLPESSALHTANPLPVKAAVNIDGPADPAAFQRVETRGCATPAVTQLLGGTPTEQPDRYRNASPLSFIPLGVPQEFIAAGLIGSILGQITSYQTAARAKGDTVTITPLTGAGHFDMLVPTSTYWKTVEDRLVALLRVSK